MAKKRQKIYKTPVIAGKYKGRNILIPSVNTTRSSKAVLRESLFNSISFEIVDSNFVEVFAGSGSIAIEAVSRGAKRAWCIERDKNIYRLLQENVSNITQGEIITFWGDSFEIFDRVLSDIQLDNTKSFFYFDPPFAIRDGMDDIYQKVFNLIKKIDVDLANMIIIEYMSGLQLPEKIGEFNLIKSRKFGKSSLAYYAPKDDEVKD